MALYESRENCECKENWDIRCVCEPRDKNTWHKCPERLRYVEFCVCNDKRIEPMIRSIPDWISYVEDEEMIDIVGDILSTFRIHYSDLVKVKDSIIHSDQMFENLM